MVTATMKRRAAFAVALVGFGGLAWGQDGGESSGEEVRLGCRYEKGQTLSFELNSVIDRSPRCEARLAGVITVGEPGEVYTPGTMRLTKLYAIKELSGSGERADEKKLKDYEIEVRLFPNGRVYVASEDLKKLDDGISDSLEDLALASHFQVFFFPLPEKAVKVGSSWTMPLDNLTYEVSFELDGGVGVLKGSPKQVSADEEVKGSLEVRFDVAKGRVLSVMQSQVAKKTTGSIIEETTTTKVTRELKVTYGEG